MQVSGVLRSARTTLLTAAVLAGTLAISATAEPKPGGTLNVTSISKWRTLNSAVQSGTATGLPASQIFAGLLRVDEALQPQPYLAESWSIAEDGLSVTFKLVEDARFHDGELITSEDVKFSLLASKTNHPFGMAMFGTVTDVATPDPQTAVFELSAPTPSLLASLQPLFMPVLPSHVLDDGQELNTHPRNNEDVVGSGPFKVASHVPGEKLELVRNDDYFIEGRPYLDKILYTRSRNTTTQVLELDRGALDYYPVAFLSSQDFSRLKKNPELTVHQGGHGAMGPIFFLEYNLRKEPFDRLEVRQALAHAIDKTRMVQILAGGDEEAITFIHKDNPFYSDDVPVYEFDLDMAAAMLDEAGLTAGTDGIRFSFALEMPTWGRNRQTIIAETIKQTFKEIGVEVDIRTHPDFGSWVNRVTSFEYDATLNETLGYSDPVIGVHRSFLCSNIRPVIWSNTEGYCNEEVDKLLQLASTTYDMDERKDYYAQFQKTVVEELALTPMLVPSFWTVFSSDVKNIPLEGWGAYGPWDNVYLDR